MFKIYSRKQVLFSSINDLKLGHSLKESFSSALLLAVGPGELANLLELIDGAADAMVGHQDQLTEGAGKVLVQEEKLDSNDVEGFTLKIVTT